MANKVFFAVQLWGYERNILDIFQEVEELGYDAA